MDGNFEDKFSLIQDRLVIRGFGYFIHVRTETWSTRIHLAMFQTPRRCIWNKKAAKKEKIVEDIFLKCESPGSFFRDFPSAGPRGLERASCRIRRRGWRVSGIRKRGIARGVIACRRWLIASKSVSSSPLSLFLRAQSLAPSLSKLASPLRNP